MNRQNLTDKQIAALPRKRKRYILKDPGMQGHYVRVPTEGPAIFYAVARSPISHKAIWAKLGGNNEIMINEARDRCREALKKIKAGLPLVEPRPPVPETLAAIAANWLTRYVDRNELRTAAELHRQVDKYIVPVLGDRPFIDIKRSDVALFLDAVEDRHGPSMADAILSTLRAMANWHASRDDNYTPPFTRNMRRTPVQNRRRDRILNDNEIRKIWQAADDFNVAQLGAVVKLLLLTGQRLSKVQNLRWDDIDAAGAWTIRTEVREKQNAGRLKLPQAAINIINAQPRLANSPYVFISRTGSNGYAKAAFDDRCGVADWRLHDLRRTSRSLMARAGVRSEIAERVLGHAIPGVHGVYNRHDYFDEKADTLERLAVLVERIINPRTDNNVVPLVAS
jgi:integrase